MKLDKQVSSREIMINLVNSTSNSFDRWQEAFSKVNISLIRLHERIHDCVSFDFQAIFIRNPY
jgi:hypothetical protein